MPALHRIAAASTASAASAEPAGSASMPPVAVSTASGVAAASLPFRQDDDIVSGPAGGAILLLLVMAVAVLWFAGRGRRRQPWLARLLQSRRAPGAPDAEIEVAAQTQLSAGVRLHVVHWKGGRVLVAVNAAGQVSVLQTCAGDDGVGADGGGERR